MSHSHSLNRPSRLARSWVTAIAGIALVPLAVAACSSDEAASDEPQVTTVDADQSDDAAEPAAKATGSTDDEQTDDAQTDGEQTDENVGPFDVEYVMPTEETIEAEGWIIQSGFTAHVGGADDLAVLLDAGATDGWTAEEVPKGYDGIVEVDYREGAEEGISRLTVTYADGAFSATMIDPFSDAEYLVEVFASAE